MEAQLSAWFLTAGRDLPWRRTRDPYAILVSEVMLQQTQVRNEDRLEEQGFWLGEPLPRPVRDDWR